MAEEPFPTMLTKAYPSPQTPVALCENAHPGYHRAASPHRRSHRACICTLSLSKRRFGSLSGHRHMLLPHVQREGNFQRPSVEPEPAAWEGPLQRPCCS
nr:uncharacterized protein LOC105493319 isoform X2 [Macaca nemestrina]